MYVSSYTPVDSPAEKMFGRLDVLHHVYKSIPFSVQRKGEYLGTLVEKGG
jgi:hypothetical protein